MERYTLFLFEMPPCVKKEKVCVCILIITFPMQSYTGELVAACDWTMLTERESVNFISVCSFPPRVFKECKCSDCCAAVVKQVNLNKSMLIQIMQTNTDF